MQRYMAFNANDIKYVTKIDIIKAG